MTAQRHRWGPVAAYLLVVAVMAFSLALQREAIRETQTLAAKANCSNLEHRVGSRIAFRDTLRATRANGNLLIRLVRESIRLQRQATDDPEELKNLARIEKVTDDAEQTAQRITVPGPPEPLLVRQRDNACEAVGVPVPALHRGP